MSFLVSVDCYEFRMYVPNRSTITVPLVMQHWKRNDKNTRNADALDGRMHSGTLVIADTPAQVNKAVKNIELYRAERIADGLCVLVEDEANAMYRTRERKGKFEQALRRLQSHMCMVRQSKSQRTTTLTCLISFNFSQFARSFTFQQPLFHL
jgi:hypothetical protein